MSAAAVLQAAIVAELLGAVELAPMQVFDAPPLRAAEPYAVVEAPVFAARDAAGVTGRTGTFAIEFRDGGERPLRLRGLMASTEELVDLLPTALPDGWRLAGLVLARSRLARAKDPSTGSGRGGWLGRSEWAVRMFRADS